MSNESHIQWSFQASGEDIDLQRILDKAQAVGALVCRVGLPCGERVFARVCEGWGVNAQERLHTTLAHKLGVAMPTWAYDAVLGRPVGAGTTSGEARWCLLPDPDVFFEQLATRLASLEQPGLVTVECWT